jgi:hypothetical protein
LEILQRFPSNAVSAVITDGPYGLSAQPDMRDVLRHWLAGDDYEHHSSGFMGKTWDSFVPGPKIWKEVMRVLKPGGHILSFSGTRTFDMMVTAMRLAGSEIRDQINVHCELEGCRDWTYGCLSEDSGVVALDGFKLGLEVNVGEQIECWNPETDEITYQPVLEKFVYDFDGQMVTIKGEGTDQLLTPNHRVYHRSAQGSSFDCTDADRLTRQVEVPTPSDSLVEATVGRQYYRGKVWCVRVSTGAFVAIRKGNSFITGNSGFPKSLNVEKALEKEIIDAAEAKGIPFVGWIDDQATIVEKQVEIVISGKTITIGICGGKFVKPKELVDSKGLGSALKPGHEPIADFSKGDAKPLEGAPFLYTAKAATKERNAGCGHLFWKLVDDSHIRIAKEEFEALQAENEAKKDEVGFVSHRIAEGCPHPCLHPDSFVLTDKGMMRIKDVEVGDGVYSHDGRYHQVTDKFSRPCPVLYRIRVQGCNIETLASDNHPFLAYRPKRDKKGNIISHEIGWVAAEDLRVGDYTMTPISQMGEKKSKYDNDFWFAMGLWLAEGSIQKAGHGENKYPVWVLGKTETHLVKKIRRVTNKKVSVYDKGDGGIAVMAFDPELGKRCLEICGRHSSGKHLSREIFEADPMTRKAFFEGYMAGDGNDIREERRAKTVSEKLAYQLKILGESVGYQASCNRYPSKRAFIGKRQFKNVLPVWQVNFFSNNIRRTSKRLTRPTIASLKGVVYTLQYVKQVERLDYDGEVVNLTVEGTHTFQTSVGMSHNTVKPISLCRWLVKLVKQPGDNLILDPFCGSGSILCACELEDCNYIGIDMDPMSVTLSLARTAYWKAHGKR